MKYALTINMVSYTEKRVLSLKMFSNDPDVNHEQILLLSIVPAYSSGLRKPFTLAGVCQLQRTHYLVQWSNTDCVNPIARHHENWRVTRANWASVLLPQCPYHLVTAVVKNTLNSWIYSEQGAVSKTHTNSWTEELLNFHRCMNAHLSVYRQSILCGISKGCIEKFITHPLKDGSLYDWNFKSYCALEIAEVLNATLYPPLSLSVPVAGVLPTATTNKVVVIFALCHTSYMTLT